MHMQIRPTQEQDLEQLSEWFIDQPWNLPPIEDGLSRYGYIASDETGDIACVSVYLTGTGYAFADWIGMNPEREFDEHRKAVAFLLKRIELILEALPPPLIRCIIIYTKLNWLSDDLKKSTWRKTTNYIQCTKLIRHEKD